MQLTLATLLLPLAYLVALARAAGPSGTLTFPTGGTKFAYLPHGNIRISYSQVHQANAQTLAIDVVLKATDIHHVDRTVRRSFT